MRDKTWEVRERREVRNKEIKERKVIHGSKGYWDVKGSALAEEPGAGMLNRILEGKCGTKREARRNIGRQKENEVRECGTRHKQSNNGWWGIEKRGKAQNG